MDITMNRLAILAITFSVLLAAGCGSAASSDPLDIWHAQCESVCELYEKKAVLAQSLDDSETVRSKLVEIKIWCDDYVQAKKGTHKAGQDCKKAGKRPTRQMFDVYLARWDKADAICKKEIRRVHKFLSDADFMADEQNNFLLRARFGDESNPFR
jgi:hypothetical protein